MRQKDYNLFIPALLNAHDQYWAEKRSWLCQLEDAYMTEFYKTKNLSQLGRLGYHIEVPEGYAFIRGFVSSLFMTSPGVQIGKDPAAVDINPQLAQTLANRFLQRKRTALERATEVALIFPNAWLKLTPRQSTDPLESVDITSIEPWNVIVDWDADSFENSRYVAHTYYLPLPDAEDKYPRKEFAPRAKSHFMTDTQDTVLHDDFSYIRIVELYDFINDKLVVWTPDSSDGSGLILVNEAIPLREWDGRPVSTLVPLYYSNNPTKPLEGYSALTRIYDQITEKNIARSTMANATRRDARQYMYKKDQVDEQALAMISEGQDGAMIPIETNESLGSIVSPVPNIPIGSNHTLYLNEIQSDLDRSSMLAPFARGQASGSTATEAMLLQQYTSSEIGSFARRRDTALEHLVSLYIRLLVVQLPDDAKTLPVVLVGDSPTIVNPESLDGKLNIAVLDGSSSPFETMQRRQALAGTAGLLVQLGANPKVILEELVRAYNLPARIAEVESPEMPKTEAIGQLSETAIRTVLGNK